MQRHMFLFWIDEFDALLLSEILQILNLFGFNKICLPQAVNVCILVPCAHVCVWPSSIVCFLSLGSL